MVLVGENLTNENLDQAREDYEFYLKITVDIEKEVVLIGGEYHADAEKLLLEKYGSLQSDVWGGGFNLRTKKFETNAIVNIRPGKNESMEILDPKIRKRFLNLVQAKLPNLEQLL